jgi:hypothetical protein|tara:strand:+ start:2965 stop:3168 length:204 start_codon:yes stop_codon:yes gene_type:complete
MKIKIPTPIWVQLYSELASYVEHHGSTEYSDRFDDDGNRFEEYEDEFCTIVDDVEDILGIFFEKENT